jgi:hypothetical protein
MRKLVLVIALAALPLSSGCFFFHDDYPDNSCEDDRDCFGAMGETCNEATKTCETAGDGDGDGD